MPDPLLSEQFATNTHWTQEVERKLAKELDEKNQSGQPYVSAMDVRRLLDELYQTTEYAMSLEQRDATRACNCRHSDADYEQIRRALAMAENSGDQWRLLYEAEKRKTGGDADLRMYEQGHGG